MAPLCGVAQLILHSQVPAGQGQLQTASTRGSLWTQGGLELLFQHLAHRFDREQLQEVACPRPILTRCCTVRCLTAGSRHTWLGLHSASTMGRPRIGNVPAHFEQLKSC